MKTACHRAYVRDEAFQSARYGTDREAVSILQREAGWLLELHAGSSAELHKHRDERTARHVLAVELDAWEEAAYRGVLPW